MPRVKRITNLGFQFEKLEIRTMMAVWSTVDSFQIGAAQITDVTALTTDRAGNVYAAYAAADAAGTTHGLIREKATGSSGWTTIADVSKAEFLGLATDNAGDLYASGASTDSAGSLQWSIFERAAGAATFAQIDTDPQTAGQSSEIAVDGAGNVFAVGEIFTGPTQGDWIVRKQTAGIGSFTTVDDFKLNGSIDNAANAIQIIGRGASAGIYVVGRGGAPEQWVVRKSTDTGTTWSTVDDFQFDSSGLGDSYASDITADASGNIYVVGEGDSDSAHWLVRKSTDGGAKWTTDDNYQLSSSSFLSSFGQATGVDASGNVFVVGGSGDNNDFEHSIVRTNAGGSWQTIDDFQSSGDAYGFAFTTDRSGNLYTGSDVVDSTGQFADRAVLREGHLTADLTGSGRSLNAITGISFTSVVGSFTDSDPKATASNFTATINWGDGHSSSGTVVFNSATKQFDVSGTHTYANAGNLGITVSLHDNEGATTSISSSAAVIARGPVPHLTTSGAAYEGSNYSIALAATDTDGLPITQWSIDWGDGTVVQLPGNATAATHKYADGFAAEQLTATATDQAGRGNAVSSTVQVVDVPPTGVFTSIAPTTADGLTTLQFSSVTDVSAADVAAGFRYSFDFNNDGVFEISGSSSPSTTVPATYLLQPGPHVIRGRVTDKDGLFTGYTTTVNVAAASGVPVPGGKPLVVTDSTQISASTYFSSAGVGTGSDGGPWVGAGGWIGFSVDFGTSGIKHAKMQLRAAAALKGFKVVMRLDDPAGGLLATFSKGALSTHGQTVHAANVTGVHNVYLVVVSGQAEINWFGFDLLKPKRARGH